MVAFKTERHMKETCRALNVLYVYDRSYEPYLIHWLFPLQVAFQINSFKTTEIGKSCKTVYYNEKHFSLYIIIHNFHGKVSTVKISTQGLNVKLQKFLPPNIFVLQYMVHVSTKFCPFCFSVSFFPMSQKHTSSEKRHRKSCEGKSEEVAPYLTILNYMY